MMRVMNVPNLDNSMSLWSKNGRPEDESPKNEPPEDEPPKNEPPKNEPMEPQTPQKDLQDNKIAGDSSPLDQSSNPDSCEESKQSDDILRKSSQDENREEPAANDPKPMEIAENKDSDKVKTKEEEGDGAGYDILEEKVDEQENKPPIITRRTLRSSKSTVIPGPNGSQSSETCDNEEVGKPLDRPLNNLRDNDTSHENQTSHSGQSGGDHVEPDMLSSTWVANLIQRDDLFEPCPDHCRKQSQSDKTTQLNYYCINCENVSCQRCMENSEKYHEHHQVLKIRRSSYHNVIRTSDLAPVVDTSHLQNYTINQAKVAFIKERPHTNGQGRLKRFLAENGGKKKALTIADISACFCDESGRVLCWSCERVLQASTARFCSLGCKYQCNELLGEDFVGLQVSGDAHRDGSQQTNVLKQEGHSRCNQNGTQASRATERRKRSNDCSLFSGSNRRKGTPCKSPVF